MQSYPNFSTPTPGTMRGPDDSPDNLIKDRVKIAEAKAAVKTLLKHMNSLDEFAVKYQNADSAIFDVRGEISNMYHMCVHLINMLDNRVITLESGNEKKGAWSALCAARIDAHT